MPQQINLCVPILQKARQRFAAATMAQSLATIVVVGGALGAAWAWNVHQARTELLAVMQTQTQELRSLQGAIDRAKAMAQGPSPELQQQVQAKDAEVKAREAVLQALREGLLVPGAGHSDRLALVARSIPTPVWVTDVKADGQRLEVSGFTLEPAALNDWVGRLGQSPLMAGLRLATVKVESTVVTATAAATAAPGPVAGLAPTAPARESWSFNLVSAQPEVPVAAATSAGGKP
jgi:Tfp pilus assembly protein PilN